MPENETGEEMKTDLGTVRDRTLYCWCVPEEEEGKVTVAGNIGEKKGSSGIRGGMCSKKGTNVSVSAKRTEARALIVGALG